MTIVVSLLVVVGACSGSRTSSDGGSASDAPGDAAMPLPGWIEGGDIGAFARTGRHAIVDGSSVLVVGGDVSGGDTGSSAVDRYDLDGRTWTRVGSLAEHVPMWFSATELEDGRLLIAGAQAANLRGRPDADASASPRTYLYDPASESATLGPEMSSARGLHAAVRLLDGRVLVVGGASRATALASAEVFDPSTDSWAPAPPMPTARWGVTASLLPDGRVVVVGGANETTESLGSVELFEPTTDRWQVLAALEVARVGHNAVQARDGVIVLGGWTTGGRPTAAAEFVSGTSVMRLADVPATIASAAAVRLSADRVLVVGGFLDDVFTAGTGSFILDAAGSWSRGPELNRARAMHGLLVLGDGRVVVVLGRTDGARFAGTCEISEDPL